MSTTLGCCGKNNVCGLGPSYCAPANCTSSCDQKSECDPGWGKQWSSAETCPLNVCCSKFGFCGTTSDFCGTKTVSKPSCGGSTSNGRTIGYYEGWSTTRACDGMSPQSIPVGAYTHLNYAFAYIDPSSFAVAPMSESDLGLYSQVTNLKESNPGLQVWISIGGWSMNDGGQPTASTFSNLAGSSSAQNAFFKSLLQFMTTYAFDGVDIDWEYPVAPERSGKPADYQNYPTFLSNLKAALGSSGHNYGLSITLPSSYWYMQNFDIVKMEPIVDWFNVMTYDLHGTWDSTDRFIGPFIYAHTNLTEIDQTMDLFWRNNISPSKITLGLGFYGRSFTLTDPGCTTAGCPFSSGGNPGPCSASPGTLMDSEIEAIIAAGGAKVTLDKVAAVKTVVWDNNQWVSYDDAETLSMKIQYANNHCLGGTMVWAASTDSGNATASSSLQSLNGLQKKSLFGGGSTPVEEPLSQCVWGDCNGNCPKGSTPVKTGTGKSASNSAIYSGCPSGKSRYYCCPGNNAPTCSWKGTAPFCRNPNCDKNEVQIATDQNGGGHGCWFNHKSLCCTSTVEDAAAGQCEWTGTAPFCATGSGHASCPSSKPDFVTNSLYGAGGESVCISGYKSFCCTDPEPYQNCAWTTRAHSFLAPFTCSTGCPAGQQIVAESYRDHDSNGPCFHDTASYYCCDQFNQTAPTTDPPNFCVAADTDYVLSGSADPDGNVADILELYWYEDDCFSIPNTGDPDSMKRSFYSPTSQRPIAEGPGGFNDGLPKLCNERDECFKILDAESDLDYQRLLAIITNGTVVSDESLEPRARTPKICLPNKKTNNFVAKSYPGVLPLSARGRQYYGVVKSGAKAALCNSLPLILGARQLAVKYVTEHVFELQTPAQFANSMLSKLLPSGAQAPGAAANYDWTQVFGKGGYMFQTWKQLGISIPAGLTGDTPADALYNALGTTNDMANLQILDAPTNSLKAGVWQIFTNIISAKRFSAESPQGQVEFINRLYETLISYLNDGPVQQSLTHGYSTMKTIMAALDSSPNVNTLPQSSFASAWQTFCADFFLEMQGNLQDFLQGKLKQVIVYWGSSAAVRKFTAAGAAATLKALQAKQANLAANVVINRGFIT
ncbi:hypothetical protein IFR05_008777 [Cadophora sp. M221]|nr:hypothetical protein IFR05_008777 [Cadophora sp. M221]